MALFAYRLMGAALLDRGMYEGVEADSRSMPQALATVLLSSLAAGVGVAGWHGPDLATMAAASGMALVTWFAWAGLMFQIGTRTLPTRDTRSSFGELLRTTGFATAPGLLQAFGALPHVTLPVFLVSWVWMFVATVVAVRQALDYGSTARTLAVCGLAAVLSIGLAALMGLVLGPSVS